MEEQKTEEKLIEERTRKLKRFFIGKQTWVIIALVILVIFGVYIRYLPLTDHNGHPGLWDITTNSYTLGPDLDPWLFERYAKTIVEDGGLPRIDDMRNVPVGFDTTRELQMVSYMVVATHKIINVFGNYPIEYSAAFMPVIFFALTIISFFLFVREVFVKKNSEDKNLKANLIASISTLFMIVIPIFLSRTVAGIPEKESIAFFFMFLAFYLFLKAWKSEKIIMSSVLGALAGLSTALMGLSWGGVTYIYATMSLVGLGAFIFNKIDKKNLAAYFSWFFFSILITQLLTNRTNIRDTFTSFDTGLVVLVLAASLVHFLLWNFISKKVNYFERIKLPRNIISLIVTMIIGILILLVIQPNFIIEKTVALNQMMFKPIQGRWVTTVAENAQPYFTEWGNNFGPFIKNIPIMFWLFFIGSAVLFREMTKHLKKKDSLVLTLFYTLFLAGLIFSRYATHPTLLDGDGFASKIIYYGSAMLLVIGFLYYYMKYFKENNKDFEKINIEYVLLLALFVIAVFSARSAVRLIMVLGPIAPIFASYLGVEFGYRFFKTKEETGKVVIGIIAFLIIIGLIFSFYSYYQNVKGQSYSFVPTMYNQQWQKAMQWVRNETPQNAVFGHWWDYGYWLQSIGNRATVLDGGNAKVFWNYWMGRLVLTGDNQKDSLDYLYAHNASYLLIDSSDIGKYGAFSSIGSDANYDRYSWIGTFLLDEKQTQETKNETILVYSGGIALDEDIIINENGNQVLLPGQRVSVGYIVLPMENKGEETLFSQPYAIIGDQSGTHKVNLKYLSVNGEFREFKEGIEACAFIFPSIVQQGQGVGKNPVGAAMFLSPRLMRGYLAQKYILNDPFDNFPNFRLVHDEPNLIVDSLNKQGMNLPDFVYYQGVQGPIKIWKITYTGNEKVQQKYLDTDASKYLNWTL